MNLSKQERYMEGAGGGKGRGKKDIILKVKKNKLPLNVYQNHLDSRTQIVVSDPQENCEISETA